MKRQTQHSANVSHARGLVLFDRARAAPRSDASLLLALVGEKLSREPESHVKIIGHANLRESSRSAELLGLKRANRIASVLVTYGARIDQLHVGSAGAKVPTVTPTGRTEPALGRRVELVWIGPVER